MFLARTVRLKMCTGLGLVILFRPQFVVLMEPFLHMDKQVVGKHIQCEDQVLSLELSLFALQDLFNIIQQEIDREFLLHMSYMEIYNEEINDLLAPEHRKLQIHESIDRGIFVAGLREEIVASADQILEFMAFGESHCHIGETNMNVYSSRSHTIFCLEYAWLWEKMTLQKRSILYSGRKELCVWQVHLMNKMLDIAPIFHASCPYCCPLSQIHELHLSDEPKCGRRRSLSKL